MIINYKIHVSNVSPGMIVSEDVINRNNMLIAPKGSILNEQLIKKIILNDITEIVIKKKIRDFDLTGNTEDMSSVDMEKLEEFSNAVDKSSQKTQNTFEFIKNGNDIEIEGIYDITKEVIEVIEDRSDLLKYIVALKSTGKSLYTHSINVSLLCNLFATWLKFSNERVKEITVAGLLHDIGKISDVVPNNNFLHPKRGYDLISNLDLSEDVKLAVLTHHELVDGSGFPNKLNWDNINEYSKVISIANYYDNNSNEKSKIERSDVSIFDVIRAFENEKFTKFDYAFLTNILKRMAENYIGNWIQLENGEFGKIVMINSENLSRPVVQIGENFVDLAKSKDLTVTKVF